MIKCAKGLIGLAKKAGVKIEADEARAIVEQIQREAKALQQAGIADKAKAVRMTIPEYIAAQEHATLKAVQNTKLNQVKLHRMASQIDKFRDPVDGLYALIDGSERNVEGARLSLMGNVLQNTNEAFHNLRSELEKHGVSEMFEDPTMGRLIANEIFSPHSSSDPRARQVAQIISDSFENMRTLLNAEGADIGQLAEYLGKQIHDVDMMMQAGATAQEASAFRKSLVNQGITGDALDEAVSKQAYDRWVNTIENKIDWIKTRDGGDRAGFLKNVYEGLITGDHEKASSLAPDIMAFKGPSNLAKKVSQSRVLHFKDGNAWFDYNAAYGSGTLKNTVELSLKNQAKNLAILETLGTNPESMYQHLRKYATKDLPATKKKSQSLDTTDNVFNAINAPYSMKIDNLGAKIGSSIRQFHALQLTTAPFWNIVETVPFQMVLKDNGMSFMDSSFRAITSLAPGADRAATLKLARAMYVFLDTHHGSMLSGASQDMKPGMLTSANEALHTYSGAKWLNDTQRANLAAGLASIIHSEKGAPWAKLPKGLTNILPRYGIGEAEWQLMRQAPEAVFGPHKAIIPESMEQLSHKQIAEFMGVPEAAVTEAEAAAVRRKMSKKLGAYYLGETDHGSIRATIADQTYLTGSTKAGTTIGEFMRMTTLFKGYAVAFNRRVLGRLVVGAADETVWQSIKNGRINYGNVATLLGGYMLTGTLRNAVIDVINGKTPRDFSDINTWLHGFSSAGGAGLYGDLLFNDYRSWGRSASDVVAGPVFSGFADTMTSLYSDLKDMDDPRGSLYKLTKNNFSKINLWYTKTPTDYLLWNHVTEWLKPGSTRKMQDSLEKRTGQEYFLPPDDYVD